jgi:hypothetical protein
MSDLLSGDGDVPDALYLAALEFAVTPAECAFRDVLVFHRDVLNGGLSQALDNQADDLGRYIAAFDYVGLAPIAALVRVGSDLCDRDRASYPEWQVEALTDAYIATSYNLAYVCNGMQTDPDFPFDQTGDQVERLLLRFARANAAEFSSVVGAATLP